MAERYGNAQTIDEVIAQMDKMIALALQQGERIGYFASLYRMVTVQVKTGILAGQFEDGARMERLDVLFANRFLQAWDAWLRQESVSASWAAAFRRLASRRPVVLQHLLLGMNAHINLDLGIAAAAVCPGPQIGSLHHDFMAINGILASLVDKVRNDLDRISPWIGLLDRFSPRTSKAVINFSMEKARNFAWDFAQSLALLDEQQLAAAIARKDAEVAGIGLLVGQPPGLLLKSALWLISLRESKDVVRNIRLLNENERTAAVGEGSALAL